MLKILAKAKKQSQCSIWCGMNVLYAGMAETALIKGNLIVSSHLRNLSLIVFFFSPFDSVAETVRCEQIN